MAGSNHVTLLQAVVGSTAYGLAREGSDVDRMGVFATRASVIAGWDWTEKHQTVVSHNPDSTSHEIRKFLKLVVKGNPSVTELLWLPDDGYEVRERIGNMMIESRESLLSTDAIYNAYCGYARAQLHRLVTRGDSFSSDTKNRTAKHARHMMRLLEQAEGLFRTGQLQVRVSNPDWYFSLDKMPIDRIVELFEMRLRTVEMAAAHSVLPDAPDIDQARFILEFARGLY